MSRSDAKVNDEEVGLQDESSYLLVKSNSKRRQNVWGSSREDDERRVAEVVYALFMYEHHRTHQHPRTSPRLPPERRFTRHRNFYVRQLNEFRHWWKTSRLLVRVSGGIVWCQDPVNWVRMAEIKVQKSKGASQGLKVIKRIGRGGPTAIFHNEIQPFTRSIRLILAICRAWEARVDNRLCEVGLAEACAFMGNRCFRYWARSFVDWIAVHVAFPVSGAFIAPYLEQNSRPILVTLGFLRAILPFAMSFQGSRFGRQVTYNTYNFANYRWRPVMNMMHFHEFAGTYQDTELDPELLSLARTAAEAIGHAKLPDETRRRLLDIGFVLVGSGCGGYTVYRRRSEGKFVLMHVTPYGPSIDDELPMFILLERRSCVHTSADPSDAHILDAASERENKIIGFTFSGAYFQAQEWAALKTRYDRELENYSNACRIMGTDVLPMNKRNTQQTKNAAPPTDLASLKAFLRTGRLPYKRRRDDRNWMAVHRQVKRMAAVIAKYQASEKAPKKIILYLEGLDCAGKSSTGMLICDALADCGYSVQIVQHNRPPTEEQRSKPWMDRGRFEYPDDMYPGDVPEYASLVWDRGPAGDFVYGKLAELPVEDKMERFAEFREYDQQCRKDGILFCKLFFVTDKDSIAKTLGKRLAHKKIARDLREWLDASSSAKEFREGLEAIEKHIDTSDFIAFNNYETNIMKFSDFVRNTTLSGHPTADRVDYYNSWLVVNTSDRIAARRNILKSFRQQLKRFAQRPDEKMSLFEKLSTFLGREIVEYPLNEPIDRDIVERREKVLSFRAVLQSLVLLMLVYAYIHHIWKVDIADIF